MKYDELRRLAEAATPGPWRRTKLQAGTGAAAFGRAIVNAEESGYPGAMLEGIRAEIDAYYIAAVSPDVILALLDERDRLLAALERIAYWEGAPVAPHSLEGFDFDSHTDCTVKEGCPAMVAREALPPGWSTAIPEGVES